MGNNPDPSEWGQANGRIEGGHLPPMPHRPPRTPKRRPSHKTWLIIACAVIMLAVIGSLLPDRPEPTGTAFPTTAPAPVTPAPSASPAAKDRTTPTPTRRIVTTPPTKTPTPVPTPTMNARVASNDWWFDRGGNQINSTITVLKRYVAAAQTGNFADAQLNCSQLQAYASTWSPQSLMTLPDPDPAVGTDLVQAFEDGRTGTHMAAGKCTQFFEKDDQGALSQSLQFAAAGASELDKVQTGMLRLQGLTPPWESKGTEATKTPSDMAEIPQTECLGARFRYEKLAGLSCDEAIAAWDRVQKTGKVDNQYIETSDWLCFYPIPEESPADVLCFRSGTADASFEAWKR